MHPTQKFGFVSAVVLVLSASACAKEPYLAAPTQNPRSTEVADKEVAPPPPAEALPESRVEDSPDGDVTIDDSEAQEEARGATAPPGLGTEWGETRVSRMSHGSFLRANPTTPSFVGSLFYNDEQGARAMANTAGFHRTGAQSFRVAGGAVSIGLRDENGRFLTGFVAGDSNYVVGEAGMRYSIVLRNLTDNRFECVISVDGLDVIDGQSASFSKRGYILEGQAELEIDGFRQSMDTVAAFRFGSVRDSYATQKHGDARNVGVIGVALFQEQGVALWTPDEIQRRHNANPFPGQMMP